MPGTTNSSLYLAALQHLRRNPDASDAELCEAVGLHPLLDLDLVIKPARQTLAGEQQI